MKKINNVNVVSNSTMAVVILSAIAMTLLSVLLMASAGFAKEIGDEFGGPGIGMENPVWDGATSRRIYGYGDLNGIEGYEVVEHKALSSDGPTNYVEYTDANPIDHSLIDMGPRSASNAAYSLHFINDGGPGMNASSNALGSSVVYNDGGPGFMVSALSGTERVDTYVENGPRVVESKVDPSDYVKLISMKPGDFKFEGGSKADKLGK